MMPTRSLAATLLPLFASLLVSAALHAAPFTPGNVVVYRVGTGTGGLINTGNPVFIDEYTPTGTLIQSIALPTVASSGVNPLVSSGTATSEGLLTRSADGRYLILAGYAATPPVTGLAGTSSASVARTVGRIDFSGNVDTSTGLTDYATGNNPRSTASDDGTNLWVTGGAGGIRYATFGAATSTQLSTTVTNLRQVAIFNGQLYVSDSSGSAVRLGTVGAGLPTTAGQVITNLPAFPTSGSPYGFFFADLNPGIPGVDTLYVASDDAAALTKYSLVGGNWMSNGTVGVTADAYRGLTGVVSGGTVTLYAVRKGGSGATGGGELVSIVDASGYAGTFSSSATVLATAPANTAFRGVALAPTSGSGGGGPRQVNLGVSTNTGSEAAGTVITVTLTADGPVSGAQSVALAVNGINITSSDYSLSSTTITIPDAMTSGSVTFTVLDDSDVEGPETALLSISAPTSGIVLGTTTTQSIAIEDNEAQGVSLTVSAGTGSEAAGTVIIVTATASAPVSGDQSVALTVSGAGITATDYTLSSNTIVIPGGMTSGSVTFTVLDDSEVEGNEVATLTLSSPTPGLVLRPPLSRDITILDHVGAMVKIYDIQGARHYSAYHGQLVSSVPGIVTQVGVDGFYMQDETGDGNDATSDGIFVYTIAAPAVAVGNRVEVSGEVFEYRPGCSTGANNLSCVGTATDANSLELTLTEIGRGGAAPTVVVTAAGPFALPAPVVIGAGGRMQPTSSVAPNCAAVGTNIESTGALPCPFDPSGNAIDFFESLEGMRVRVNNPVATSGFVTNFDEFWVLADNGAGATGRNARGGITISSGDMNPERIMFNLTGSGTAANLADLRTGARWTLTNTPGAPPGAFDGIFTYEFGDYKLDLPENFVMPVPDAGSNALTQETTALTGSATQLTIASFNVENLAGNAPQSKYDGLADVIVNRLKQPDIIGLMELQDNNGQQGSACPGDGIVSASTTISRLLGAIASQPGGITYQFVEIDPQDCTDGGAPTGNIRVGFFYNAARVGFTGSAGGGTLVNTAIVNIGGKARLQHNPGRIDPTNPAFTTSRKPLAAEFTFNGQEFIAVANHWDSKGGDYPEYGRFQPPVLTSEVQRLQIAAVVKNFVQSALDIDANTKMVILGDFNDFQYAPPLVNFKATTPPLLDLVDTLPATERYTYNFRGNSQVLDHIIVTPGFAPGAQYDVVHVNSEFRVQVSDHDPEVARLDSIARRPSDFDGNGKSDLVFHHADGRTAVWLMDGLAVTASAGVIGAGTSWQVAHIADLNGDGKSDLVWQNPDGRVTIYIMNGTAAAPRTQILNAGEGWTVTQAADLDGDGNADLVFQNTDGTIAAWLMNGASMSSGATLLGPGTGWSVTRTADFNGDGKKDLLFTHADGRVAIWLMDGLTPIAAGQIMNAGSGWTVAHTADFDGDGKADIVWQHTDGRVAVWLMNGAAMASGAEILGAGTGWSVTRTGDFDGDGKGDLLFMHTDGRSAIFLMNGLVPSSTTQILNAGGGWSAKRVADLDGDGKSDIVWENADGRVAVWLMNGPTMTSGSEILGPGTGWSVSGASQ
jgi:predicted extracellular nuclease